MKREDRIQTQRGRQRFPNEAARGPTRGANPFLDHAAPWWDLWRLQGQREESRKKREEILIEQTLRSYLGSIAE